MSRPEREPSLPVVNKSFRGGLLIAPSLCCLGLSPQTHSEEAPGTPRGQAIEEVVVSAQKRVERLQDVPVPVTAIPASALAEQNTVRLQDYYSSVPGLNLTSGSKGDAFLSIRGVTTGITSGNPTVGITIDDVPYGSSSTFGAGGLGTAAPDIDPSDLARVEVLRGPQGTLYGASSIGGLLKFVTVDPSLDSLHGGIRAGASSVAHSSETGFNLRGNINAPLSDTVAIRASGFTRRDPGYIDDPARQARDVNRVDVDGGRISTLWRPSNVLSVRVDGLLQHTQGYGSSDVYTGPGFGDLQQNTLRGTGAYDKRIQLYDALVTLRLKNVEITSVTGYGINKEQNSIDFSSSFGTYALEGVPGSGFDGFGVSGAALLNDTETKKLTQELRLSMPLGKNIDWLFGLFYNDEDSHVAQQINAVDPATGATVGQFLSATWPTTYKEYAVFTTFTFQLTDQFDLQLGGRQSENKQTYSEIDAGLYGPVFYGLPDPIVNPEVRTSESSFTYLVTPRFKFSDHVMAYARLASGYRPGGPNPTSTVFNLPPSFKPDTTENYEIGLKADLAGGAVTIDSSIYYIDWKDIQLSVFDPVSFATYYVNASRGKSQGLELAATARPTRGLSLSGWLAWNDAVLTESFPPGSSSYGVSGDRLPASSRFSGHVSLEQEWQLRSVNPYVAAAVSYVGDRKGGFVSVSGPPDRQTFPSYTQTDLRVGVRDNDWSVNLFATNVTDERGVLAGGLGTFNPIAFIYIQPRTIGLSLDWSF